MTPTPELETPSIRPEDATPDDDDGDTPEPPAPDPDHAVEDTDEDRS